MTTTTDPMTVTSSTARVAWPWRVAQRLGIGILALVALCGVAVLGLSRTGAQLHQEPRPVGYQPVARAHGAGNVTVAVVLGATGTIGTDAMAPYALFASSPEFTVYTIAAHAGPAPVQGGPGIVPAHTFDEVESGQAPIPDVVVVPALENPTAAAEQPVRDFVLASARRGSRILSVCNGAWRRRDRPARRPDRDRALVPAQPAAGRIPAGRLGPGDSGTSTPASRHTGSTTTITTTAGISSGIPGALHLVAELAGGSEATRVSTLVPYPGWTLDATTQIPAQRFSLGDLPALVSSAVPWGPPTVGIVLADGVSEVDVAAEFEVPTVSGTVDAVAVTDDGWITTRHGMVLAGAAPTNAPRLHTRVVPSTTDVPGHGFEAALRRLSCSRLGRSSRPVSRQDAGLPGADPRPGLDVVGRPSPPPPSPCWGCSSLSARSSATWPSRKARTASAALGVPCGGFDRGDHSTRRASSVRTYRQGSEKAMNPTTSTEQMNQTKPSLTASPHDAHSEPLAAPIHGDSPDVESDPRGRAGIGRIILASMAAGLLAAVALAAAPFIPASEDGVTGAVLLGFALGWALLAVLSTRFSDQPQRWAAAPALFMGLSGVIALTGSDAFVHDALAWVWPLALLALVVWMFVQARRHLHSRTRWWVSTPCSPCSRWPRWAPATRRRVSPWMPAPTPCPGSWSTSAGTRCT